MQRWSMGVVGWVGALAVSASCGGSKDGTSQPTDAAVDGDTDTETTPIDTSLDTGTDTGPTGPVRPQFDCYADFVGDDLTSDLDPSGFDGYDAANPTFLLYSERDNNGNGVPEQFGAWVRDSAGRTLHYEASGSATYSYDVTYDADGNRLTYDEDSDGDGDYDYADRYEYTNGFLTHYENDEDGDGQVDYQYDYERDADGHRTLALVDEDGDGTTDTWITYVLDAAFREAQVLQDDGNDGVYEFVTTYTFTDPVLRIGTLVVDEGNDAVIDQSAEFEYDAIGRELHYAIDFEADGVLDYSRTYTRDPDGRVLTYFLDTTIYGYPLTLFQAQAYDSLGRLIQIEAQVTNLDTNQVTTDVLYNYVFGGTCPS